ncbi:polysaccharide deacetylase family protein [Pseudalkalibacillus sp. SCS-8]|uniref:polysaccharide deacetylase family protein n=1 Tax=Pseudalkalibacillus nanhaiensis TaxID=3115291 RepID=UPI0032DB8C20
MGEKLRVLVLGGVVFVVVFVIFGNYYSSAGKVATELPNSTEALVESKAKTVEKKEAPEVEVASTTITEETDAEKADDKIEAVIKDHEIPILMYHHFDEELAESTVVSTERFREQMTALKEAGYNTISDDELHDYLFENQPLPENPILITIDDGYRSNYTIAYPILKEHGMKATIYVVVDHQDETPGHYPHLTWEETKEMYESGWIDIQSHTYNSHVYVESETKRGPALTTKAKGESDEAYYERVKKDLQQSKEIIEEQLGKEVVSIAYPYGAHNDHVIAAAKELGYKIGYTVQKGINVKDADPFRLKRLNVVDDYDGATLLQKIEELN